MKAGGGDGCEVDTTELEVDVGDSTRLGEGVERDKVVVVIVEVEVLITVETVLVVITVGVW